jgi:hypothetical protein
LQDSEELIDDSKIGRFSYNAEGLVGKQKGAAPKLQSADGVKEASERRGVLTPSISWTWSLVDHQFKTQGEMMLII